MATRNDSARSEESFVRYLDDRAMEKYQGNGPTGFHADEFKKSVDYLRSIAGNAEFTSEDVEDMARAARLVDENVIQTSQQARLDLSRES